MSLLDKFQSVNWAKVLTNAAIFSVILFFGYVIYIEAWRNWRIYRIMDGDVRGNKKSKIYHLPQCPNYNSIKDENRVIFNSMREAEKSGFQASDNCDKAIISIRWVNEENAP